MRARELDNVDDKTMYKFVTISCVVYVNVAISWTFKNVEQIELFKIFRNSYKVLLMYLRKWIHPVHTLFSTCKCFSDVITCHTKGYCQFWPTSGWTSYQIYFIHLTYFLLFNSLVHYKYASENHCYLYK
jgi:hypothetical protein